MKKTTRVISIIMSLVMCLSLFAVCAFAEDEHVHSYSAKVVQPTCAEQGYTIHTCSGCGDYYKDTFTPAFGHTWGAWATVDEATCIAEGHNERVCSVCDAKETKTIPVIDHTDKNGDSVCDVCGSEMEEEDNSFIQNPYDWFRALWAAFINWIRAIFK